MNLSALSRSTLERKAVAIKIAQRRGLDERIRFISQLGTPGTLSQEVTTIWHPQPGPQTAFYNTWADICVYGGSAGSGKTSALLMEPAKYLSNPSFNCVTFRRTSPQITNPGGLWDDSLKLYYSYAGTPLKGILEWRFPSGAKVTFRHLEHETDRFEWSGAQINLLQFDELFTFSAPQFWFLTSRNRSTSGVRPYVRATTNPDPDSWLADLLAWWIDQETGFPLLERAGVIRWLVRNGEELVWFDEHDYLSAKLYVTQLTKDERTEPKSVTFIPGRIDDNAILLATNPEYLSNLHALPYVEKMQLLYGNWKVRPAAGNVFNRTHFEVIDVLPHLKSVTVRAWDKAGTEGGGKFSAGVKMSLLENGVFVVEDVVRGQWAALSREEAIKTTATQDGTEVEIWQEQEPGSGGKESAEATVRNLAGFYVRSERPTGSKGARANPYAAQCQAHNVKLLRGTWNKAFLDEHHNFDPVKAEAGQLVCDQVDAAALAFIKIAGRGGTPRVRRL